MAEHEQRGGTDLYAVLGLTPEATSQEIRAAYQQMAGSIVAGQASPIQRQAIEEAFETLGDPIRRLRYDAQATAPPPPRFQMPSLSLSGARLPLPTARLRAFKRPDLPHIDPMLAAAIALVVIVGIVVVLLPLIRGRGKPSAPAQSVADLVTSPTPTLQAGSPTANAGRAPTARSPILGIGPGGAGPTGQGSSLLPPLSSGGSQAIPPGGLLAPSPTGAQATGTNEPPFLTGTAILDMLRAVAAASAVRNAPSPSAASAPSLTLPANASSSLLQPSSAPAGIPITGAGSIPPLASAAQPSTTFPVAAAAVATPAPTATPAPNHIAVPGAAVSTLGVSAPPATRPPQAATSAPNRFVPAPTPVH